MNDNMKDTIALHARKLFDKHGFHGASLRDICELSGCKMPTLYYYYKNKETLYDFVVGDAFERLVEQLWLKLPENSNPKEYASLMIIQKKQLSDDEKLIYRLAMKTWLGFEDCGQCKERLMKWEQDAYEDSWQRYQQIVSSKQWAKYISRSITSIIQRIILLNENISDTEIREEINMIFDVAMQSNT
ncbi:MAG: TetR/AcrR family transcriptional regulator [Coprobacillaceae bacterium]